MQAPSAEFSPARAVVVGASAGIGKAIAEQLTQGDCQVFAGARSLSGGQHIDVVDGQSVQAFFDPLPEMDLLVYCAGHGVFGPTLDGTANELDELSQVHLVGLWRVVCEAIPKLSRRARVVVLGSLAAREVLDGCALYSAAKAGQDMLVRHLRAALRPKGVRVLCVVAGAVATRLSSASGLDTAAMLDVNAVARSTLQAARDGVEEIHLMPMAGAL